MAKSFERLNQRLQDAFRESPHLVGRNLRVESEEGNVVLRGRVSSYFQKQMAQETVRAIDEVVSIENQLEVSWPEHDA